MKPAASICPMPPLEGIRVIDHGHVWAGPLLGMMMADLGAEVIKVGPPHRQSGISMGGRQSPVGSLGGDRGTTAIDDPRAFHGLDRGKMSIALHLGDPRGVELYLRLIAVSDIVFDNFAPRVMPALGLDWETLRAVNPRLIMASLSAAGATDGPWRDLVTYGPSLAALYGLKSLLGYPDDPQPREDPPTSTRPRPGTPLRRCWQRSSTASAAERGSSSTSRRARRRCSAPPSR